METGFAVLLFFKLVGAKLEENRSKLQEVLEYGLSFSGRGPDSGAFSFSGGISAFPRYTLPENVLEFMKTVPIYDAETTDRPPAPACGQQRYRQGNVFWEYEK